MMIYYCITLEQLLDGQLSFCGSTTTLDNYDNILFIFQFQPIDQDADRADDDEHPFFPLTHEIDLKHGTKSVSCLTIDSNGERLISGGFDYELKMWDIPTMNKTLQYYRAISPCESHQLRSIEFSPANDMLLIASGSCQGKVISRDGKMKFIYE